MERSGVEERRGEEAGEKGERRAGGMEGGREGLQKQLSAGGKIVRVKRQASLSEKITRSVLIWG